MVRTEWAHLGPHAGLKQYFNRLDPSEFRIHDRPTPFEDESLPGPRRPVHEWLRGMLRVRGMPWYTTGDLWSEMHAVRRILMQRVDVLHYFDPEHGMQYLPLLLRRNGTRRRVRILATFHQPPDMLPHILRRDVVGKLDHVTVVSPDQAPYFEECLPVERISVILHGVDTDFFHPPAERPAGGAWTCLTVGHNLRDFDAIRCVAERLRQQPDIRFVIVSPQRTGVEDLPNVTVHRGLADEALRRAYQTAHALFLPLQNATANNALLEGMASGLPVVTTDLASTRAYAPAEALFVQRNDPDGLVAAIHRLRADPEYALRAGLASRRRAEELRWDRITPQYADVYRRMLGRNPDGVRGSGA